MASRVAALLLLGVICVHFAAGEIVVDCCLKKAVKPLPLQILDGYIIQDSGNGCQLSATAFITKGGRILCVSHPNEQDWVKKHIQMLDRRRQRQ